MLGLLVTRIRLRAYRTVSGILHAAATAGHVRIPPDAHRHAHRRWRLPRLNAVIRAVVRKGIDGYGDELVGFRDGWRGVLEDSTTS